MRVVIRTIVPLDEDLYERTVGQVSDLSAELHKADSAALEPTMTARLEEARVLAVRYDAAMVVWFEHPPAAGPVVLVALPSRDRVLVRHIAVTSDAHVELHLGDARVLGARRPDGAARARVGSARRCPERGAHA